MKLSVTRTLPGRRERVFAALMDPGVIAKCIEGCERLTPTGDDTYDAHLKVGVAGMKGTYVGRVAIRDRKPPESFTLLVEGKGAPGFVKAVAHLRLTGSGDVTELACEADVQVGGLIAAVGSRLIESAGKKLTGDFLDRLSETLQNP